LCYDTFITSLGAVGFFSRSAFPAAFLCEWYAVGRWRVYAYTYNSSFPFPPPFLVRGRLLVGGGTVLVMYYLFPFPAPFLRDRLIVGGRIYSSLRETAAFFASGDPRPDDQRKKRAGAYPLREFGHRPCTQGRPPHEESFGNSVREMGPIHLRFETLVTLLWYDLVTGGGLRSVGWGDFPSTSDYSILPVALSCPCHTVSSQPLVFSSLFLLRAGC
jgi:hypothetical protein